MITDIYRIKTANSIYEIHVKSDGGSRCRKEGGNWRAVKSDSPAYLENLFIGPSFDVPGVVTTSRVQDYAHFVVDTSAKRHLEDPLAGETGIPAFFQGLTEHIVDQVKGGAVMVAEGTEHLTARQQQIMQAKPRVYKGYGPGCSEDNHVGGCTCDLPPTCKVPGCDYSSKYGPGHNGSRMCKSGSIASGGTRSHCSCDYCY